jgi:transglycosylase-like protein with SLT domain
MPDTDTLSTSQDQTTSPYQGVSNPPSGPITTQDDSTPTPTPTGAGPSPSAAQPQPQQAPQNAVQSPAQPAQGVSASPQGPSSPGKPQQPNPATQPPAPQPPPKPTLAENIRSVAETLAGGPATSYRINANTGTMEKVSQPLTPGHIGMAIALEAISGSLSGLAQRGPGANARGAQEAFAQAEQKKQQQIQMQKQQATEDYARQTQITETNMRMRNSALQLGKQDYDQNQAYVNEYGDVAARIQKDHPEQVLAVASYADFPKYDATLNNAIPYKVVPRLDNGKQAVGPNGEPLWDINYLIVKPNFMTSNAMTDANKAIAKEMGLSWADNPNVHDAAMNYTIAANLNSKIANYKLGKQAIMDAQDTLNSADVSNDPKQLTDIPIKYQAVSDAINNAVPNAAQTYGVDPILLMRLAKGVVTQESGGNPNVPDSKPTQYSKGGAIGPMQLTPDTAKTLNVDPRDTAQNVTGGVNYLAQLLSQFKDPKLALAAYNAGPNSIVNGKPSSNPDNQKYVASISSMLGLTDAGSQTNQTKQFGGEDWAKLNSDNPTLKDAIDKFQAAYAASNGSMYAALNHLVANGQSDAANLITSTFLQGDMANAQKVDLTKQRAIDLAKQKQADAERRNLKLEEATDTKNLNKESIDAMNAAIAEPPNWDPSTITGNESRNELKQTLKQAGVAVDEQGSNGKAGVPFDTLYAIGHYDLNPKTTAPPKVYNNGKQYEMDSQTMLDYIRKYINPNYNDGDYDGIHGARVALYNPKSPEGVAIQSVGTAMQHMKMLDEAVDKVPGRGDLSLLNHLATMYGLKTGNDAAAVYKAIAPYVADEVSKAAMAGGTPYQQQIEEGRKSLEDGLSNGQTHAVLQAYRGLIGERMTNLDGYATETAKEHLRVPEAATNEMIRKGIQTPWAEHQVPYGKVPAFKTDKYGKEHLVGYADDNKGTNYRSF